MNLNKQEFDSLHDFLDREAQRINNVEFIVNDPVQFPRRFTALQDIEIVSFLAATIAWGKRKMICDNCEKMLAIMENAPLQYVESGDYELLPDKMNIHRTFFARDFKHMLRGLKRVYERYGSLNDFAKKHHVGDYETPAWKLVELLNCEFSEANNGCVNSRCMPTKLDNTALKRVNMALRWLVRDDGIVDMGVWSAIKPSQLYIPLDVHVGDTARALGLVTRRANDKKTALELTDILRRMCPTDPVIYDFALFGIGIGDKYLHPSITAY